jgi:hypothetical protein
MNRKLSKYWKKILAAEGTEREPDKFMEQNDTFYHYCSNETLCSIINNTSIRLSSLSLSNDKTEGRLVSGLFKDLAAEESVMIDDLLGYIKAAEENNHALGFCLSAEDDLLSQWRGYADNASGVAIGFSRECLEKFSDGEDLRWKTTHGQFVQVEYSLARQKELIRPIFEVMKDLASKEPLKLFSGSCVSAIENNSRLDAYNELQARTMELLPKVFLLKDEGFSEEREWRVIIQLDERDMAGFGCDYRVIGNKIVPYKDFSLDCSGIREVVLGPRNTNSELGVMSLLESKNIWGVNVRKSQIPYC